jgi:hypothetical protein
VPDSNAPAHPIPAGKLICRRSSRNHFFP